MATTSERYLTDKVGNIAQSLGYEATFESAKTPIRVFGWFRGREIKPDLYLESKGRSAIVLVETRPVLTYDIFQVDQMRGKENIGALICVPDSAYPRTKESVKEYAKELDVRLCSMSDVEDAMRVLLEL